MGGYGSGRWALHSKSLTVENTLRLHLDSAVADTIRSGSGRYRLIIGTKPSQAVALGSLLGNLESSVYRWEYEVVEDGAAIVIEHGQPATERIAIARRALRYGARLFWLCPGCNRRAAILYRRWGRFRCRQCHGLTYKTAQEADKRVYALARADNPAALAALPTGDTLADLRASLLAMRALSILMKRNRRELKKLGVDTSDMPF
jgi:hypothetical protein